MPNSTNPFHFFDNLPQEIIKEGISTYLRRKDIASFRLASKRTNLILEPSSSLEPSKIIVYYEKGSPVTQKLFQNFYGNTAAFRRLAQKNSLIGKDANVTMRADETICYALATNDVGTVDPLRLAYAVRSYTDHAEEIQQTSPQRNSYGKKSYHDEAEKSLLAMICAIQLHQINNMDAKIYENYIDQIRSTLTKEPIYTLKSRNLPIEKKEKNKQYYEILLGSDSIFWGNSITPNKEKHLQVLGEKLAGYLYNSSLFINLSKINLAFISTPSLQFKHANFAGANLKNIEKEISFNTCNLENANLENITIKSLYNCDLAGVYLSQVNLINPIENFHDNNFFSKKVFDDINRFECALNSLIPISYLNKEIRKAFEIAIANNIKNTMPKEIPLEKKIKLYDCAIHHKIFNHDFFNKFNIFSHDHSHKGRSILKKVLHEMKKELNEIKHKNDKTHSMARKLK